jgi:hypothetical protein
LERLAQRQEEELQQTLALLKRVNSEGQSDSNGANDSREEPSLTMTAVSLLRGADYGFQSRSDGATIGKKR